MTARCLKLLIADADDLAVAAAVLQDAIVPAADMAFLPDERRFVFVANRFCWESAADGPATEPYERVNCGVTFEDVRAVSSRGTGAEMLNLLTVGVEGEAILLVFAGGGAVRLDAAAIRGHLEDIGEPWPSRNRPRHADLPEPGTE
jgi:hypothetical protein